MKKNLLKISNTILEYLLDYRKNSEPDFTFSLRKKDSPLSKEERLSIGQWFQGSNYIFVPLFRKGCSKNKTKTIGFVLTFENDNIKECYLEIVFRDVNSGVELEFYKELLSALGIEFKEGVHQYFKSFTPETNYLENLHWYISDFRSICLELINKHELSGLFVISNEKFTRDLKKINKFKESLNKGIEIEFPGSFERDGQFYKDFRRDLKIPDVIKVITLEYKDQLYPKLTLGENGYGKGRIYFNKEAKELFIANNPDLQGGEKIRVYISWSNIEKANQNVETKQALNQILFGPPGTGKTYHTVNKALEIIYGKDFNKGKSRKDLVDTFEKLKGEGQIVFTTFHQSLSYEDFIEGIKPLAPKTEDNDSEQVIYDVIPGIFKQLCDKAKEVEAQEVEMLKAWEDINYFKMSVGGKQNAEMHDWCLNESYVALGWGGLQSLGDLVNIKDRKEFKIQFKSLFPELIEESSFHMDATYRFLKMEKGDIVLVSKGNQVIDAIGIIDGDYEWNDDYNAEYCHLRKVKWIAKNLDISPKRFITKNISQQSIYEFYKEDVKEVAIRDLIPSSKKEQKKYVIVIDEINRGNIAQIFGELITLIEEDKRIGCREMLTVTLPYSKNTFGVPSNLYIIGTMNTADRSVEALDTALRRRFSFVEMPPKPELISEINNFKEIDLKHLLETINQRIEILMDRDHMIGHSYFLSVSSLEDLKEAFQNKIVPLLQEYFFGDYGKIGLVLGEGFIDMNENNEGKLAKFYSYDASIFDSKPIYNIKDLAEMDNDTFKTALETLLTGK